MDMRKRKRKNRENEIIEALKKAIKNKEIRIIDVERYETPDGPMHIFKEQKRKSEEP